MYQKSMYGIERLQALHLGTGANSYDNDNVIWNVCLYQYICIFETIFWWLQNDITFKEHEELNNYKWVPNCCRILFHALNDTAYM